MAKRKRKLTDMQTRFVEEYLKEPIAKSAAIEAGYSKDTAAEKGYELIHKNSSVAQEIQKRMDKRSKKTEITADYVLTSLKSVAERCQQAEPVLDKQGNPTGEYQFREAGANKALELLGKNLKLFTDKLDVNITLSAAWERATDEEKRQLIEKLEGELEIED